MVFHNLMEEIITTRVPALFEEAARTKVDWLTCSCPQCQADTICYVLNKVPPRYIASSRGVAYSQQDGLSEVQLSVDIDSEIIQGMKHILSRKRPHFETSEGGDTISPAYNFPAIVGKVLNGATFEPIFDIQVELYSKGDLVTMIDKTWHNPYNILEYTPGTFTFWPSPEKTEKSGIKKLFPMELRITAEGYESVHHFFDIQLTSESKVTKVLNTNNMYRVPDIFLFKQQ